MELLARLSSEQLILRFEQEFDLPMRHHVGIGMLEVKGAFTQRCRSHRPAVTLGAFWVLILRADVTYQLLRGLEAIADSSSLAASLSEQRPTDAFSRYVLARWYDAVGRLQFRCGDMMEARLAFEQAAEHAAHPRLWRCRPDIGSNLLRSRFDERQKAGAQRDFAVEAAGFAELLTNSLALVDARGVTLDFDALSEHLDAAIEAAKPLIGRDEQLLRATLGTDEVQELRERCELVRGLSNVLHNLSIVQTAGQLELALQMAKRSAALAFMLGDEYRLAQALRHRATLLGAEDPRSLELLLTVRDRMSWPRGRWMATQAIAKRSEPEQAVAMLEGLLQELEVQMRERGEDTGFDVDVYRYALETVLRTHGLSPDAHRMHERRLEVAASVRRVVKVATYRSRFAQVVYPVYLDEIQRAYEAVLAEPGDVEPRERLCDQIEQTSARDLLDTLMTPRERADEHEVRAEVPASTAPVLDSGAKQRSRTARSSGLSHAYAAIGAARQRFEARALKYPISSTLHDSEVTVALRRLTCAQRGLGVVRYFGAGWDAQAKRARSLHALVVRLGRVELFSLHTESVWKKASAEHAAEPSAALAATLGQELLDPLWAALSAVDQPLEHLVLIPAAGMFSIPLHVATLSDQPGVPLCVRVPLSFSVSVSAFVAHRRYLLRTQPRDPADDLCALVPGDEDIYPGELEGVGWDPGHFHLAGSRPAGLAPDAFTYWGAGDSKGLHSLLATQAEFFVFAGHGVSIGSGSKVDVALKLAEGEFLTQYDLAGGLRLQRNKLTVLGACVSGLGGDTASGEVAGFIRSFIAAGAGALAVTLWPVEDELMAKVVGGLLRGLARDSSAPFDFVKALHELQRESFGLSGGRSSTRDIAMVESRVDVQPLRRCPIVLYL